MKGRVGVRKKCQLAVFNQCYAQPEAIFHPEVSVSKWPHCQLGSVPKSSPELSPSTRFAIIFGRLRLLPPTHTLRVRHAWNVLACVKLRRDIDLRRHWTLQSDIGLCNLTWEESNKRVLNSKGRTLVLAGPHTTYYCRSSLENNN